MLQLKRILVTTDLQEKSLLGIKYAISLAHDYGAQVLVLHVAGGGAPVSTLMPAQEECMVEEGFIAAGASRRRIVDDEVEAGRRCLQAFLESHFEPATIHAANVTQLVRLGRPAEEIVAAACQEGCDLIVMASKGKGWLARAVAGSMSETVARHAPCPVVTIQPSAAVHDDGRWVPVASMELHGSAA